MVYPEPFGRKLQVALYAQDGETTSTIDAEITADGDLLIFGHDMGQAPLEFWGQDEYECWLTVGKINKQKVIAALLKHCDQLGLSTPATITKIDERLLSLLKTVYGGHAGAVSEIQEFLKAENIPAEFNNYF